MKNMTIKEVELRPIKKATSPKRSQELQERGKED